MLFVYLKCIFCTQERYAFVWDSMRVSQIREAEPFNVESSSFVRPPYCAAFRTNNNNYRFAVCEQHAVFGDFVSEREAEAEALEQALTAAKRRFGSRVDDVLICGDFNLPPQRPGFDKLRAAGYVPAVTEPARTTGRLHSSLAAIERSLTLTFFSSRFACLDC